MRSCLTCKEMIMIRKGLMMPPPKMDNSTINLEQEPLASLMMCRLVHKGPLRHCSLTSVIGVQWNRSTKVGLRLLGFRESWHIRTSTLTHQINIHLDFHLLLDNLLRIRSMYTTRDQSFNHSLYKVQVVEAQESSISQNKVVSFRWDHTHKTTGNIRSVI